MANESDEVDFAGPTFGPPTGHPDPPHATPTHAPAKHAPAHHAAPKKQHAKLVFPLFQPPLASYRNGGRYFGAPRSSSRLHAACDLLNPHQAKIRAVADGVVIQSPYDFYLGTNALEVHHPGVGTIRYGEIDRYRTVHLKAGDHVQTLKLLVAAAGPLAPGDKRLKEVIDQAGEVMKTPLGDSPEVALGFIARLHEAWSKASRILPSDYLDHHARRLLLDQRLYQKRKLGNATWIRALFTPTTATGAGASAAAPIYLPDVVGPWMPLFPRFSARVIAEAVPQQDHHETCPVALRVCALARVVTPKPRARG